jgi:hypothetical protein
MVGTFYGDSKTRSFPHLATSIQSAADPREWPPPVVASCDDRMQAPVRSYNTREPLGRNLRQSGRYVDHHALDAQVLLREVKTPKGLHKSHANSAPRAEAES